jgi:hypothetical protein
MKTMTLEGIESWPALRWQAVRRAALAVLWKGPLLGLEFAAFLVGGTAWFNHRAGQTLDFGWFQIPGRPGAPRIPVFDRFCTAAPMLILIGTGFLALVAAAAIVTTEIAYRWGQGATKGQDS